MGHNHHVVGFDQARLSDRYEALSSPTRLNTSSLQTLSDQVMLKNLSPKPHPTALQPSHVLFLQGPWFGSIQKSTRVKMTVFIILFFRQRLKAFVSSYFLLANAFSGCFRCNFFFTGSILCNKAPKVVKVRFLAQLLPSRKIVNSSRPGLLLTFITLVFLTLIFMPYSSADSCILSIISYWTG